MSFGQRIFRMFSSTRLGRFITTRIRHKMVAAFLAVAVLPLLALGTALYLSAANSLEKQSRQRLAETQAAKSLSLRKHLNHLIATARQSAADIRIAEGLGRLNSAFEQLEAQASRSPQLLAQLKLELSAQYATKTAESPEAETSTPDTQDLVSRLSHAAILAQASQSDTNAQAGRTSAAHALANEYQREHGRLTEQFRNLLTTLGARNVLVIDQENLTVTYSQQRNQLGLPLASLDDVPQPHRQAIADLANNTNRSAIVFEDFAKTGGRLESSLLAVPVFHGEEKVAVLAFQIPAAAVNDVLSSGKSFGKTGETYLVGSDHLLRTESRFAGDFEVGRTAFNPRVTVKTQAVDQALEGQAGIGFVKDYRGKEVLAAWEPLAIDVDGKNDVHASPAWALVSQIDLEEIQAPIQQLIKVCWIVGIGSVTLILIVSLLIAGGLTKQSDAMTTAIQKIEEGEHHARAEVLTQDELGAAAEALNRMADKTLSLIQSREERDAIQYDIQMLMEEVADVATGNLTVEANIERPVTGSIADSINYMIAQLRSVVCHVKRSTLQVTNSARQIRETTEHLSRGSEAQAAQIVDTSAAIDQMSVSISHVAGNTEGSARIARQARENAVKGAAAVRNTIQGMDRIRNRVQDSAKRIKRLGESSQEIGEIVQIISEIADRTSILALNASIQAAMAGDAGQGFAVVAEEVERLAERSNESTRQIAALIKAIQTETADAMTAMEESTREVVDGSRLAVEAGSALGEIEDVSGRLDELIQEISLATKQQAHGAEALARSMNEIANVTQQTAEGTKGAALSVTHLASLAEELRSSVSTFRLTEDDEEAISATLHDCQLNDLLAQEGVLVPVHSQTH